MRNLSLLTRFSVLSLVLFIVMGVVLGLSLTQHFEEQAIDQQKTVVSNLVPPVIGPYITKEILEKGTCGPLQTPDKQTCANSTYYQQIQAALGPLGGPGLVRIKVWNRDGMIIY